MANVVYLMCALTSIACAVLLIRGFRDNRSRLLLWSSLCFVWLAANNLILVIDRMIITEVDLHDVRLIVALGALALLVYGLIWEAE